METNNQPIQVPFLKKEAIIGLGTAAIQELQEAVTFLSKDINGEELKKKVENKVELTNTEKSAIKLISVLKAIFEQAKTDDQLVYKPLDQVIGSVTGQ